MTDLDGRNCWIGLWVRILDLTRLTGKTLVGVHWGLMKLGGLVVTRLMVTIRVGSRYWDYGGLVTGTIGMISSFASVCNLFVDKSLV